MSAKTQKNKNDWEQRDPYPIGVMMNFIARCFLYATVVILPLYMNETKYSQITKCKGNTFMFLFLSAACFSIFAILLGVSTKVEPYPVLTKKKLLEPPFFADAALLTYWVFMLVSSICAVNPQLAFFGIQPRNNGFLYQTMYVAGYFLISRGLKPRKGDAFVFVWGGAALGVACILHFFGVDIYNIRSVNGDQYAGPFWTTTKYRFLGPVGNVNLGSYILAVAAVIAAGLYVAGVFPGSGDENKNRRIKLPADKYGISLIACFAVIIYAEYNINTDAGVVALAVAALLMPAVLCTDLSRLRRMLRVYFVAIALLAFNNWLVDFVLRKKKLGTLDVGLLALALVLGVICAAGAISGAREKLSARTRYVIGAVCGAAVAATAGVSALLVTDSRFPAAAKSKTPLNTFGSMLRSDSAATALKAIAVLCFGALAVWGAIELWSRGKITLRDNVIQRACIIFAAVAVVGGISLSLYLTKPAKTAVGAVSGACDVIERADLKAKSDNMLQELGQMLRGNPDDSFGHNRLFTWKRTLRLVKLNPVFGIGPDNFKPFFARYFHDEAVKQFPSSNGNLDKAHNEFLDVLIDNGIAGLIAYLAFFGALLWFTLRRSRENPVAAVFGVALAAYMAHAFFGYQLPIQSPVMWMMIAATAAFIRAGNEENGLAAATD